MNSFKPVSRFGMPGTTEWIIILIIGLLIFDAASRGRPFARQGHHRVQEGHQGHRGRHRDRVEPFLHPELDQKAYAEHHDPETGGEKSPIRAPAPPPTTEPHRDRG